MEDHTATKPQVKRKYAHLTWVVSGSLFAAGMGLSLSLLFLGTGVLLMLLAVVTSLVGMGTVALIPRLISFVPHPCPFCGEENEVLACTAGYWCDSCGFYVRTALEYDSVEVKS